LRLRLGLAAAFYRIASPLVTSAGSQFTESFTDPTCDTDQHY